MGGMSELPSPIDGRAVIHLAGPDARALLQRVVTGDAEAVSPEKIIPSALLTPQGKIIADFLMHEAPDGLFLDIHESAADGLVKKLTLYRLRAEVRISRRDDLAALWSPQAFDGAAPDPRAGPVGWRGVGPAQGEAVSIAAKEIAAGLPAFGRDYGEAEVFPTDVNLDLIKGVAWTKGCYIGQEVVSRMKRRGTIRKRTLPVRLTAPAEKGAAVTASGSTLGEITSAQDLEALALIRLDRWEKADGPVEIEGAPADILRPDWLEESAE